MQPLARWKRKNEDGTPVLPGCDCGHPLQNAAHVITECPLLADARNQHLGTEASVHDLQRRPKEIVKFLRDVGLLETGPI